MVRITAVPAYIIGNTTAKNQASEIANVGASITNNAFLNCQNNCGSSQSVICTGGVCPPGVPSQCNISGINQAAICTATNSCVQNASSSTTVNQSVAQQMQQTASVISAGLGLGGADASNVADATANVSTQISTNYQTNLSNIAAASESIVANACVNNIYAVDQNVQAGFSVAGQQTVSAVATATQQLSQSISQSATAVNLGLLVLLIGIAIIIIALGYFVAKSGSGAAKIIVPIVILGGVGVGGYVGYKYLVKKAEPGPNPLTVTVSGTAPPPIEPGAAYQAQFNVSGADVVPPLTWTVLGTPTQSQLSTLNLSLDSNGLLSTSGSTVVPTNIPNGPWGGVPTSVMLTVYVTDSASPHPNVGTNTWIVPIANEQLSIATSPSTIPGVVTGQTFPTVTFTPSGGSGPYFFNTVFPNNDAQNLTSLGIVMTSQGVLEMQDQGANPAPVVPASQISSIDFIVYVYDSSTPVKVGSQPVSLTVS